MEEQLEKLTELFKKFPGIGPRQARRFVFFLLQQDNNYRSQLIKEISTLEKNIINCSSCQRFFANKKGEEICSICSNPQINRELLTIVEKDADLYNIHRSGVYQGLYFIIGRLLPFNAEINQAEKIINWQKLIDKIIKEKEIKEIIIALSASVEGDYTAEFIKNKINLQKLPGIKITTLGRGLSTGTELEYSDSETIKNAFKNKGSL